MILKVTVDSLQKVESEFTKIIHSNVGRDEKLKQLFSLMAEGHVETQSIMKDKVEQLSTRLTHREFLYDKNDHNGNIPWNKDQRRISNDIDERRP